MRFLVSAIKLLLCKVNVDSQIFSTNRKSFEYRKMRKANKVGKPNWVRREKSRFTSTVYNLIQQP